MPFREGEFYSRQAIHDTLGGDIESFLPQRNHEIVCGCFNTRLNPSAPREVLVGDKPRVLRAANLLVEQPSTISVFLKRGSGRWEYVGIYRVAGFSTDQALLKRRGQEANRPDVTMIVSLELV